MVAFGADAALNRDGTNLSVSNLGQQLTSHAYDEYGTNLLADTRERNSRLVLCLHVFPVDDGKG